MKKSELIQIIKEEYAKVIQEEKVSKIDGVHVSYSKTGNRTLQLPKGMSGTALSSWLKRNNVELDKEFPIKK